jgi:NADPH:quinone reductase-like Zn-dependent oxidoreductase
MKALVVNALDGGFDLEDIVPMPVVLGHEVAGIVAEVGADVAQAPWGGFKYSGIGREFGRYGIEAFLETRAILES